MCIAHLVLWWTLFVVVLCMLHIAHRVYKMYTFSNNLNRMDKQATKTAPEKKIQSRSLPWYHFINISHLTHSHIHATATISSDRWIFFPINAYVYKSNFPYNAENEPQNVHEESTRQNLYLYDLVQKKNNDDNWLIGKQNVKYQHEQWFPRKKLPVFTRSKQFFRRKFRSGMVCWYGNVSHLDIFAIFRCWVVSVMSQNNGLNGHLMIWKSERCIFIGISTFF